MPAGRGRYQNLAGETPAPQWRKILSFDTGPLASEARAAMAAAAIAITKNQKLKTKN